MAIVGFNCTLCAVKGVCEVRPETNLKIFHDSKSSKKWCFTDIKQFDPNDFGKIRRKRRKSKK